MSSSSLIRCAVCMTDRDLKRCTRCQKVWYCSKEHQREDWGRHKAEDCLQKNRKQPKKQLLPHDSGGQDEIAPVEQYDAVVGSENEFLTVSPQTRQQSSPNLLFNSSPVGNPAVSSMTHYRAQTASAAEDQPFFMHRNNAGVILDEVCQTVISDMNEYGLCVVDNFLGEEAGRAVLNEVLQMPHSQFRNGQLVSSKGGMNNVRTIRSDIITWLDGKDSNYPSIGYLINQIDTVVYRANSMANNGQLGKYSIQGRTKAMVACYPGSGTHYVKHVDNPNKDGRRITAIYYLNQNWDVNESGGLLRIFPEGWRDQVADIIPKFDRLLFFWSDRRNPHEVQPAYQTRYAITLWYFDSVELEERYKRNREKVHQFSENGSKCAPGALEISAAIHLET